MALTGMAAPKPADITTLFPLADKPVTLSFRMEAGQREKTHEYRIIDYNGEVTAQGVAKSNEQGLLSVTLKLPVGYHEVNFGPPGSHGEATGLWSRSPEIVREDPFFCIDAGLSWLTQPEERPDLIRNVEHLIAPGGLVRERMAWQEIHAGGSRWDWETKLRYESTRKMYAKSGVPLLEVFHNAPTQWGRAQGGRFPDNLLAAASSWHEVSQRWHGYWGALEVWNEPDIGFGGKQPADQYLPLLKTIRYTMRSAGIETPIGGGVFATNNRAYITLAARNGLLDECEFVSFHYYGDPLGLERLIGQHRAWLGEFGYPTKPLWLTETGITRPGKTGVRPNLKAQIKTALTYAMQAVESRACGITRFFPFVYPDYSERSGSRHYGMLDHNRTPLRILAAMAQTSRALSGTTYAGDLPLEIADGAKRFRVFAMPGPNRGKMMIVAYTGEAAAENSLTLPFSVLSAHGIDGRVLPMQNARTIPIPDGIAYLKSDAMDVKKLLLKDTNAMRLYQLAMVPSQPPPPVTPIVLQPQLNVKQLSAMSSLGYFLSKDMARLPVQVGVNNLGKAARKVSIRAGKGPAQMVTVAGGSREIVTMEVAVPSLPQGFAEAKQLDISAVSDGGERIAPVSLAFNLSGGWDIGMHLKDTQYQFPLSLDELYRWEKRGSGKITFAHEPPATWGFKVSFPQGVDRWAYPRFTLPQEVDLNRITGVLLRGRCMANATVRLMSWDEQGRQSFTPFTLFPSDGEWHVAYVSFESYQQADVGKPVKISIGLNSAKETNALEVSELYLIGK